jgi:hypothetical protein
MKVFSCLKTALVISGFSLALGCQKEKGDLSSIQGQGNATELQARITKMPVTRAYRDSFDIDLSFKPDLAAGWTKADPDAPAWFYGTGFGNATHMGNVETYFNTHTLRSSAGIVMVYQAPVNQFYAVPLQQYNVPEDVSAVHYDGKGNSIWFRIAMDGWTSWHTAATHVAMKGNMLIVGGTGKFVGATGETNFHAEFNQLNLHDATMWQSGKIRY